DDWCDLTNILWRHAHSNDLTGITNLRNALTQQLSIQWRCVQLLKSASGCSLVAFLIRSNHLCDRLIEISMATPQTLSVDHAKATLLAHFNDKLRACQCITWVIHERQIKLVGVNMPSGVDIFG